MAIGARLARRTRMLAWGFAVGCAVLGGLIAAPGALAQITGIHSDAGPLTDIYIGDNLTCQVAHTDDTSFEFYSPSNQAGHCETDVSVGSTDNAQLTGTPVQVGAMNAGRVRSIVPSVGNTVHKGDPIAALRTLAPWLKQCHLKDATRTRTPAMSRAGGV